jgi:prolyl oligopeptidase
MRGTREFSYPEARRQDLTEEMFGHQVSDPYRWIEDAGSAERAEWLAEQARLFAAQREGWPGRDRLAARAGELLNVGLGTPVWRGERSFFTRRDPGQEHAVLYTSDGSGAPAEVLIDPMAIDPSGLTTLDAWQPDKEGRLLAYQLSEGGGPKTRWDTGRGR